MFRSTILPGALALATIFSAAPALAAGGETTISTAGLDLSSAAGRAELDKRIDKAANQMCADQVVTGTNLGSLATSRCKAAVREEIIGKLAKQDGSAVAAQVAAMAH